LDHQHESEDIHGIPHIDGNQIPKVDLMPHLKPAEDLIFGTLKFFFTKERYQANAPFKGFVICGPVGTGKTELAKQVARRIATEVRDGKSTYLVPIDSAVVASPKWGEAEGTFRTLFSLANGSDERRVVLLFDDLESLFLSRGASTAREWHYSLSSLFFHLVDSMNPFNSMVLATTNRADLIDTAIRTRLYGITVSEVPMKELLDSAKRMIEQLLDTPSQRETIFADVETRLRNWQNPTIRDCRQLVIISCIENKIFL
jgi:SpoVK/Ycf46/Vps4 family AAA+-type ATPase